MSYQTEEQQVEQLKEWWKDNGTPLIVGAVLGLSGFFGWKFWTEKQEAYQVEASNLYSQLTDELKDKKADSTKVSEKAEAVKTGFPDTSYAILSAYQLAKIAVNEGKLDQAAAELTWVLDNHSSNELAKIAKIRLARILVAQQKADKALPLLSFEKDSGYFELASLVKGDALSALGKDAEALESYKAAENAGKVTASHPSLKLKIQSLEAAQLNNVQAAVESNSETDGQPADVNNESKADELKSPPEEGQQESAEKESKEASE